MFFERFPQPLHRTRCVPKSCVYGSDVIRRNVPLLRPFQKLREASVAGASGMVSEAAKMRSLAFMAGMPGQPSVMQSKMLGITAKTFQTPDGPLPIVRDLNLGSISELVGRLRSQPFNGMHDRIIEAMVTTETSFFRDLHPFEALRKTVIPDLVNRRRAQRSLSIWCAATASGQDNGDDVWTRSGTKRRLTAHEPSPPPSIEQSHTVTERRAITLPRRPRAALRLAS